MTLLVLSPFLFGALLLRPLVTLAPGRLFPGGIGAGTMAIPAFAVCGDYAMAGRRFWFRVRASLPPLSAIPVWALTAGDLGGPEPGSRTAAACGSLDTCGATSPCRIGGTLDNGPS